MMVGVAYEWVVVTLSVGEREVPGSDMTGGSPAEALIVSGQSL